LGHRFVPHSLTINQQVREFEFGETSRKLGWKVFFDSVPIKNTTRYVRYTKGSWPPDYATRPFAANVAKAKAFQRSVLEKHILRNPIDQQYTVDYWRRRLRLTPSGTRFLQCDKNLGVRAVDGVTYAKLAAKECKNYEVVSDVDVTFPAMDVSEKMFARVAAAVSLALPPCNGGIDLERFKVLQEISGFMRFTLEKRKGTFTFPRLRMLLKVHKTPEADGLVPTRPIIPNFGLPSYHIAKWLGGFMAKMAKTIPWNLESTDQFLEFIKDPVRSPRVASFDFSNLYGNEPVRETLSIFFDALTNWVWKFDDVTDEIIFKALMAPVKVPEELDCCEVLNCGTGITYVFMLLLAECIHVTIAELDLGEKKVLVATEKFLAMGCPPVAPLSIISLAYLEAERIGYAKCAKGMKRLIDDIIIDLDIISEAELRAAYPSYLKLNHGDVGHFLDVSYAWVGNKFVTFPYVKPFMTVPLNANSCHPWQLLRATVKNELRRLMKLCSETEFRAAWVGYWRTRFRLAGYSDHLLSAIETEVFGLRRIKAPRAECDVNHIEMWAGVDTKTNRILMRRSNKSVRQTWRVGTSLLSMALKAHERQKTIHNNESK